MPKVTIYNQEGKTIGDLELSEKVFGVKPDAALVHEAVIAQRANARKTLASTKTRGEVRGGGKKPWKQKGTGRARQGSTRSPNWVGGGIAFGPRKERNFEIKINKKARQKALRIALSDKVTTKHLLVVDAIKTDKAKTKVIASMIKALPLEKTTLVVSPASNPTLLRMVRNLPNVKLVTANSVNLVDVLAYRSIVMLQDAVPVLEKIYA